MAGSFSFRFNLRRMQFSLSTHWHAYRHVSGEELIDEALELGFDRVELGYDLRHDLIPGVQARVADGSIRIGSVHNFCPIPVGAPMGHPELFTFADPDARVREQALRHTRATIDFAAELGARVVVAHMGNVKMRSYTRKLIELAVDGLDADRRYEKTKIKLLTKRDRKSPRQLAHLYRMLEQILPHLEATDMVLAMENLPTWEAFPTELEAEGLLQHFDSPHLRYWHDFGHAQIRQNLGLSNHLRWLDRLRPYLAGCHVHDVVPPAMDHAMPPDGHIDFPAFRDVVAGTIERVFEPSRRVPPEALVEGVRIVRDAWADAASPATDNKGIAT